MYQYRQPEIKIRARVGVDEETYKLLRGEKKKQKKSMTRIIKDLILKEYGKPRTTKPISTKTD